VQCNKLVLNLCEYNTVAKKMNNVKFVNILYMFAILQHMSIIRLFPKYISVT